jgi:tRNA A-37 threonylcarbamoyl transferase component Bud32
MKGDRAEEREGDRKDDIQIIMEARIEKLKTTLKEREEDIIEIDEQLRTALSSISLFETQQQQLFDEFVVLRSKYDALKASTLKLLWNTIPNDENGVLELLRCSIPKIDINCLESTDRVGKFQLLESLGDGQFATVRACREISEEEGISSDYAAKVISKEKVSNFMALRRVGNEIDVLRRLSHPGILRLESVLHTENFLYIVTERGGPDLFDFFEAHPEKFSSTVARKIMMGILNPIAFCHANGVCHRDLKPENVLLQSHTNKETKEIDVRDIKLCDFGLCETVRDGELLDDFCGSPGFFAPEIVTAKKHDGKLTDIWSLGCILLELTLGHECFNTMWMAAYDYHLINQPYSFQVRVCKVTVEKDIFSTTSRYLFDRANTYRR